MRVIRLAIVLVAAGLLASACSSGDDDETATPAGGAATAIPTATPYVEPPPATIVAATAAAFEPTPTATAPAGGTSDALSYTVQPGDSLLAIAARFGVDADEIAGANGITDPSALFVGQELLIPGAADEGSPEPTPEPTAEPTETPATAGGAELYVVQSGDTVIGIAAAFGVTVDDIAAANGLTEADFTGLQIGQELLIPQ
jgi:LysM repeat protein